jgi:xylan 1,4-beta-xylosidase
MDRRTFLAGAGMAVASSMTKNLFGLPRAPEGTGATKSVEIDLSRKTGPFPHYWENAVGSDRTAVGFREQWQQDLAQAHKLTGVKSVRCHGLFDDEMGVCTGIDPRGNLQLSFLYVSQIYDKMLELGVRPFVELSFMPTPLSTSRNTIFFYKGNVSPPKKMEYWGQLVKAFTEHCVKRYGIAEVSQWQFECWNEPNINFWAGTQTEYFELYRHTAIAVKSVDRRIQVGGPATAQVGWVPELIMYCANNNVPLDFVSTHIYASDPQENIFGKAHAYPYEQVMPRAIGQAREQIRSSTMPGLPLLITEWSSQNPAFIAQMIRDCAGLCETMSYWTFDNVFEEGGPVTQFFNGFGLIGQGGVPRPSFHAFSFLHKLGESRLSTGDGPVLATRRADGSVAILVWNLGPHKGSGFSGFSIIDPIAAARREMDGAQLSLTLKLNGAGGLNMARVTTIDMLRGSPLPAWESMGKPQYPSVDEINKLKEAASMPKAEERPLASGELSLQLPASALALIEIDR